MTKILIVDDHDVVRKGLVQTLREEVGDVEIGEATDSKELLIRAGEEKWDLYVVDIRLPGRSGLDVVPDLRRLHPETPILIISAFSEEDYGLKAYKLGAKGFIHKSRVSEELPVAAPKLLAGETYVSPNLAPLLVDSVAGELVTEPHELLSDRESEIMRLIASGYDAHEIARELSLSENTVGTYRGRIYKKLKVKNNVDITRYALKHGLVD